MKKLTSLLLCAAMLPAAMPISAAPVVKQGMESRVYINGSLGEEYNGKNMTFMVLPKNETPQVSSKEDIYYINQLKLDKNGGYELTFELDTKVGDNFDVWVNEDGGGNKKMQVADYTSNFYIDADVDYVRENGVYTVTAELKNIFAYSDANYMLLTAFYDGDGRLEDTALQSLTLPESNETVKETISDIQIQKEASAIKFFVLRSTTLQPATKETVLYDHTGEDFKVYKTMAEDTTISYTEMIGEGEYADYVTFGGRWQENAEKGGYIGYWVRPYFEFRAEGKDVKVNVANASSDNGGQNTYYLEINGKIVLSDNPTYPEVVQVWGGTLDLSPYLTEDVSEVKLIAYHEHLTMGIAGITLGKGTKIYKNRDKKNMLFIGDSITSAERGYSYLVPAALDADFTTISRSSASLRDDYGVNIARLGCGMESQFDRLETFKAGVENPTYTNYDASKDSYDYVFVNLGTNDAIYSTNSRDDFKESYRAFIKKLQGYYPNAKIIAMRPFNGNPANDADRANFDYRSETFSQMNDEGYFDDPNVYYLDTSSLEMAYEDTLHPQLIKNGNDGHVKATAFIINWLKDNKLI